MRKKDLFTFPELRYWEPILIMTRRGWHFIVFASISWDTNAISLRTWHSKSEPRNLKRNLHSQHLQHPCFSSTFLLFFFSFQLLYLFLHPPIHRHLGLSCSPYFFLSLNSLLALEITISLPGTHCPHFSLPLDPSCIILRSHLYWGQRIIQ